MSANRVSPLLMVTPRKPNLFRYPLLGAPAKSRHENARAKKFYEVRETRGPSDPCTHVRGVEPLRARINDRPRSRRVSRRSAAATLDLPRTAARHRFRP